MLLMAMAVLGNLASDAQVAEQMTKEGVLEVISAASTSFPGMCRAIREI